MRFIFASLLLLTILHSAVCAQDKFFTKKGLATFDATTKTSPEAIAGKHKSVIALLDTKAGSVQFSLLLKGFLFEKALMEEHFNENYVESDKYPKSEFKGDILDNGKVNYAQDGVYNVKVKGNFSLHGITKEIEVAGKVIIKNGMPRLVSSFPVALKDHNIKIPQLVGDKVADVAKVDVDCTLEPLKK